MASEQIPYGVRRYPAFVLVFGGMGGGMLVWASHVTKPTFVFPFGTLDPEPARWVLSCVGALALGYLAVVSFIRFVRRPQIVLAKGKAKIPVGEFGTSSVELVRGDVHRVDETKRAGGWRVLHVAHRGGQLTLSSSNLPDDAAFERVRRKLEALQPRSQRGSE